MTTAIQVYGDISPRSAAYAVAPLLKRHDADMILEKFGQTFPLPTQSTIVAKFRRYEALPLATTALVEGVTPSGTKPTITDYTATLEEFGDFIPYSGFMLDTHEDPILKEYGSLCVQQAAETIETLRWNKIKAGSQVGYANGGITTVNTVITLAAQRTATAALLRQRAHYINEVVSSSPDFRTEPVEASFVAIHHPDVTNDIRNMQGFIPAKQYAGQTKLFPGEVGAVEDVRYCRSVLFTPVPRLQRHLRRLDLHDAQHRRLRRRVSGHLSVQGRLRHRPAEGRQCPVADRAQPRLVRYCRPAEPARYARLEGCSDQHHIERPVDLQAHGRGDCVTTSRGLRPPHRI